MAATVMVTETAKLLLPLLLPSPLPSPFLVDCYLYLSAAAL
jgi:hypothetical protein